MVVLATVAVGVAAEVLASLDCILVVVVDVVVAAAVAVLVPAAVLIACAEEAEATEVLRPWAGREGCPPASRKFCWVREGASSIEMMGRSIHRKPEEGSEGYLPV